MAAIRTVFIVSTPMMGLCLALCLFIKDRGLQRPEEREQTSIAEATATDEKTQKAQEKHEPQ
jgi:hypothetical protein